jgi:mannose-1-phosphate guanylyltransferase
MIVLPENNGKRVDGIHRMAVAAPKRRLALLLSGGDGKRLQELTTQLTGLPIPKQYCPLMYGRSLLELALFRTHYFASAEDTRIVINHDHLGLARAKLQNLPDSSIFIQPENRDTGPGMIFALSQIARTNSNAIVATFPTDHFIDDERTFIAHVLSAACMVQQRPQKIAVLGVKPNHPGVDYGYILPDGPLHTKSTSQNAHNIKAFVEKPGLAEATELISQGGLWNTFVMVFHLKQMLALLREMAPADSQKLFELQDYSAEAPAIYRNIQPWSFSTRILARIPEKLIVFEVPDIRWSDWGTRESIERTYKHMNLVPSWRPLDYEPRRGVA